MSRFLCLWLGAILRLFRSRQNLLVENLALRQQLSVLKRRNRRPKLAALDRLFWPVTASSVCSVNQRGQLPGGCEHGNVSAEPLRQLTVVCPQSGLAVAQGECRHTQGSRNTRTGAVPFFLLAGLAPAFGHMRRQSNVGDELLLRGEAAQVTAVFAEHHFHCFHPDGIDLRYIDTTDSI